MREKSQRDCGSNMQTTNNGNNKGIRKRKRGYANLKINDID